MKIIVAGSRDVRDYSIVRRAIELSGMNITTLISGGARGVDWFGECWANDNGVPVWSFKADWAQLGRKAGPMRNEQMAQHADGLIAVWDGRSRGTADMIQRARRHKLQVYVHDI